jgi:hypothetical protein
MITSVEQLREWFEEGQRDGHKFMLIICDTFDWTDYPVYTVSRDAAKDRAENPGEMQKVMEVYDLSTPFQELGMVWDL